MMKSLDPHSSFMTADMYKELQVETKGAFGGLGIEITIQDDILTVISPIEDTPAFAAGVKAGDRIIKIDGKSTKGITTVEAVKKLRGRKNTRVTITIMREDMESPKDFVITRAIIKIKSVKFKIYDDIAYIRISAFQERTAEDLKKALGEIGEKTGSSTDKAHLTGLILDMRNNPGGILDQAVEVSDVFLKSGVVVSTKGRSEKAEHSFMAADDGNEPTIPIIVLVNEGTASAAEIVSGALQDSGRALILGTQTFGKGTVQTVIQLEDGAAVKLTTAKFYTPLGKSIQAEGITPDIVVERIKSYGDSSDNKTTYTPVREKDIRGHLKGKDEKREELAGEETDVSKRDNQLQRAIDLLKSWEIFKKSNPSPQRNY
jgi:carboxyl-terminal processing protease